VREWAERVKHNLPFYTALASAFACKHCSNLEKFSFPFESRERAKFLKKLKENFSEFETSLWLVRKPGGN
jgi:hypothetical protein